MWLTDSLLSAVVNVLLLAGIPFLGYFLFHKLRHKRSLLEVALRAGLQRGELRYVGYCAAAALASIGALLIWPPPLDSFTQHGSPQADFVGLGVGLQSITMALLYGIVKTGFPEELLFRGLIAGSLSRRLPLLWANLLQALIFLLPHGLVLLVMPRMWGLLPLVFGMALVAGWVRVKSDSILGPALLHACLNIAVCLSVAARS